MVLNNVGSTCSTSASEVRDERAEEEPDDGWKASSNDHQDLLVNNSPFLEGSVYRGEGNANLVLAIPSERKVVRFRKSSPGEASMDGGLDRIRREIEFLRNVISSLLGDYVQPPEAVRGNPEDMVKLSEAIRPLRPKDRCTKEIVEEYATKYVDYTFLPEKINAVFKRQREQQLRARPTFSVEIKPKQGFRHELDQRFKKCTYCLTQYYKLNSGSIESLSDYCPYDLFSGDTERMKKSLRGLIQSPQNNFRIFRDGIMVYDSNSRISDLENIFSEWFGARNSLDSEQYFELFFRLVKTTLLRKFPQSYRLRTSPHLPLSKSSFKYCEIGPRIEPEIVARANKILNSLAEECNFDGGKLPRGSVLERVHYMQQIPYHSVDAVYEIYSRNLAALNDEAVYSHMIKNHRGEKRTELLIRNGKRDESLMDDSENPGDKKSAKVLLNCSDNRARSLSASKSTLSKNNSNKDDESIPLDQRNNNNSYIKDDDGNAESSITADELEALQNYLIVTTARDCAILMAFEEIDLSYGPDVPENYIVEATDKLKFLVNVGVLDLDPKSIHCIKKHRIRDENVLISLEKIVQKTKKEEDVALMNNHN